MIKIRAIVSFFVLILLLLAPLNSATILGFSGDLHENDALSSRATKSAYDYFQTFNIASLECRGEYVDYLGEYDINERKVIDERGEKLEDTTKTLFSDDRLFVVTKEDSRLRVAIPGVLKEHDFKMALEAMKECVNGYFLARIEHDKGVFEWNDLELEKLALAEQDNTTELVDEELNRLGIQADNKPVTPEVAEAISDAIHMDTHDALDPTENFENLQKIADIVNELQEGRISEAQMAQIGVAIPTVGEGKKAIMMKDVNEILHRNRYIDRPSRLQEALRAFADIRRQENGGKGLKVTGYTYGLLGLGEVTDKEAMAMNDALMLRKKPIHNIGHLKVILQSVRNANVGTINRYELFEIGVSIPDQNRTIPTSVKVVNELMAYHEKEYLPTQINAMVQALDKMNHGEQTQSSELNADDLVLLGVQEENLPIKALNNIINMQSSQSVTNNPAALRAKAIALKKLEERNVDSQSLRDIGVLLGFYDLSTNEETTVACVNKVLSAHTQPITGVHHLDQILTSIEKLHWVNKRKRGIKLEANDLSLMGVVKPDLTIISSKDKSLLHIINKAVRSRAQYECIEPVQQVVRTYYKTLKKRQFKR
jgi:hypothetical protein